jgi:enoyl-CoA hydratase/carnithine racemase
MADDFAYEVRSDDEGRVRTLVLNRADKLNAFTAHGYDALTNALDAAAADGGVAVCVITGSGRAFSAGVDLNAVSAPGGATELGIHFNPMLQRLATFPKPLIAAVNGLAVGLGATLLLHCDMVVVDEEAKVRMPFVALGTCAEASSSWLLPKRVGPQQAMWMVLSGRAFSADEVVANGFALTKAPAGQSVPVAMELARQLAEHEIAALVANKALLREGWATQIVEVWAREQEAMKSIAQELGPIGWSRGASKGR